MERLWATWRSSYVEGVATKEPLDPSECVLCHLAVDAIDDKQVIERTDTTFTGLNAYPYCSGHVMVVPNRHVADLEELTAEELHGLMEMIRDASAAVRAAYEPDGLNVGMNLGRAAGAGIPGHLHVHIVPRWYGDTNFMSAIAETRVLPESLPTTWGKLRAAWPPS